LCDENKPALERFRAEFGSDIAAFPSVPELLAGTALDGVVICTPTRFHFEQVQACRGRGLHVLCEKPLADTRERILELIEQSRSGPLLSVAYQRRYSSLYRTLRREVQSSRWGPVRSVTTHNSERWQQTIAGTWRDDPQINPGGFLGDAGSHKIDMLFYITGLRPEEVFAYSDRCGSRVEIVTTITGRLSQGVALSMSFIGNAQHWREDFQVHCAEADLSVRENRLWIGRDNHFEEILELEQGSSPDIAFLDTITLGAANEAPPECALPVYDFTQAVLQSARTGQPVQFSN
jgi:predicted dehydrogenase